MQSTGYFATIYRFGVLICGPQNRVFDIKSGHDFCRYRNSIQVIYFQINDYNHPHSKKRTTCSGQMKTALNNVLLPTLFKVVNNTEQVDEPELTCNQV